VEQIAAKIEASVLLEQKLGGSISQAARDALDDLARLLSPDQLRELFHALPDAEAARFMEGLAKARTAEAGLTFSPQFLAGIGRAPRSLAMVGRGEIETANRLVQLGER